MARLKKIRRSKYRGVWLVKDRYDNEYWVCRGAINGNKFLNKHKYERDAAKDYDWILIMNNKSPVNIYKQQLI